jgi:hypothetical protein
LRSFLVILLLPYCARGGDLYHPRALSEKSLVRTYTQILLDACQQANSGWKPSTFDPAAGYWGDGVSAGNEGIRTVVSMALACATVVKYDDGLSAGQRLDFLDKAAAALRFATATHLSGPQKCPDRKKWGATDPPSGANWQSGLWTGTLGCTALLLWDRLDQPLQKDIERVIAWECDSLARGKPPVGLWWDTKAEENGWNVPPLVLGELMFPSHPRVAAWHESAEQYMMNTLCTAADLQDTNIVDGRPVKQWVLGANLQPDFTLENHGFFHPSYVACSSYFLTQAALYCTYAGRPVPQAALHHLLDTWNMFQTIILPRGEPADPQGMDWELHGLPFLNLFASLATRQHDPLAARLEQQSVQYLRAWQLMGHGSLSIPGSSFGIARHAINAEQVSYGLLAHKIFGPAARELTARAAADREVGVWDRPYVDFIAHRTEKKFASFSWKNKIMGLLIPIAAGHGDNPEFTVPIADGFIGSFDLGLRAPGKMTVTEHTRRKTQDGFETAGTLLLNGGQLKQTLKMTSIGERTVVYEDRVVALSNVTVRAERGLPLGIENDEITGGHRVISDQAGQTIFDWKTPSPPQTLPGTWANVSGRLGIVMVKGSGLAYAQAKGYTRGISVYTDTLYGSYSTETRKFKPGEEVVHRLAILFVEATPKETAAVAQSCKIESQPAGQFLRFQQPAGAATEVPLF